MESDPSSEKLKAEIKRLKQLADLYKNKYEHERSVSQKLDVYSRLAPVAIIDWNLELKVEWWNKVAEKIFGFKAGEAMGLCPWEFVEKADLENTKKAWEKLFKEKGSKDFIRNNLTKSGNKIICDWHNTAIFHEEKLVGFTSVVIDISNQKNTELKLLQSKERFKTLSSVTFEAIFLSENGYGVDVNEVGVKMFGYNVDEIKTMYATELFVDESKAIIKKNTLSGYIEPYEAIAIKKDGTKFPVEIQRKNYLYDGRNIRVTAIRDITDRKKDEQRLRTNELKFRTIFENVEYGILVGGLNKKTIDANESFCKMSGYSRDELIGNRIELLLSKESLKDKPLKYDVLEEGKPILTEREILTKNGHKIPVEMNSKMMGKNYFISIFTDLTERKKTEKELKRFNKKLKKAKERAEESNNLKTAFLQNMSHEIRTPMNGIVGFSEMLNHPDVSEKRRGYYTDIIIKSGKRLLDIVNDILDISKLETGLIELVEKNTNINKLLSDLFNFYQQQAWQKNIDIHLSLPLSDYESTILVDQIKLRQVLSNLISNAVKFTHKGYIKIGYQRKNEKLEFYIEDTGIGIDDDLHDKIFERFRQAELTTTRKYGGTGLGLSISRANVKLLKGELWLVSKKENGSIFYFTVPYKKHMATEDMHVENYWKGTQNMELVKGSKILIAEDEEYNYMYLKELISELEIDVLHAHNGNEAIEMVEADDTIQLVLMDIKMPELNGYLATREIKKIRPDLPVIAQTAYALIEDREKALAAGCDDYISKPINRNDLLNMVRSYL